MTKPFSSNLGLGSGVPHTCCVKEMSSSSGCTSCGTRSGLCEATQEEPEIYHGGVGEEQRKRKQHSKRVSTITKL